MSTNGLSSAGGDPGSASEANDRSAIRDLIESWVVWRDSGDWARFATVWHDDGVMVTTWQHAAASEFIARARAAFDAGVTVAHMLGGTSIDVRGRRAVAHTKMQIIQHGQVDGVPVEATCVGRFVDALERRDDRWGIVQRQPVYEMDRIVALDPGAKLHLRQDILERFPAGYRHLAYLQTLMGFEVNPKLPGTRGPEIAALNDRMRRWLSGEEQSCLTDTCGQAHGAVLPVSEHRGRDHRDGVATIRPGPPDLLPSDSDG